jgi:P-type conjugative transfer protein TrbJ
MKKIMISVSLAFTLAAGSASADTVFCVNCGNELTQYANFAQLSAQTSNLISQLEVMRAQAARLSSATPFSQSSTLLASIMGMVNQGQALGYNIGNITQKFETQYPGFGKQQGNYYDNYKNWSRTTADSIKSALMSSGLQMDNFATESATADTLRQMNQSSTGQMQAIQVGNAVSSEMLDELRKLRQLNTAQMQAQNAYLLGQQEQMSAKENNSEAVVKSFNRDIQSMSITDMKQSKQ